MNPAVIDLLTCVMRRAALLSNISLEIATRNPVFLVAVRFHKVLLTVSDKSTRVGGR